jgi:hypothetical protein
MTLLRLDPEALQKLIDDYERAVIDIKKGALQMAWYMRGGATYEDILNMSATERQQISQIIDDNLEATKKSGLPFF